ncbi:tyrosine-type recombinase/integrase [Acidocella facilis]|uniref:tyrosine-type recombinase/integrase n=1 Tax=Acidocella facilis TaxID=525 RepID=UPI002285BBDD|nr:tyrosine-type recombinase/integrase [Acidocella facilis]
MPTPRPALTPSAISAAIRRAVADKQKIYLPDTERGLSIRIYPTGKAVWYGCGQDQLKRKRWVALGEFPGLGVSQARDKHRTTRLAIRTGANPVDAARLARERKAKEEEDNQKEIESQIKRQSHTLQYMLSLYEPHAAKTYARNKNCINLVFGENLTKPITDISRQALNSAAKDYQSQSMANQAVRMLQAAIRWGTDHLDWVPESLRILKQPNKAQKRQQMLDESDISNLLPVLRQSQGHGQAMWLMVHVGCRLGEATNMTWDQIDITKGIWTIPGSTRKNTRQKQDYPDLVIDLPRQVLDLLKEIKATNKTDHVFTLGKGKLGNWDRYTKAIQAQSGVYEWHRHDLRHYVKTKLSDLGTPREVSEAVLGHAAPGLDGVYNHSTYPEQRKIALQKLADYLDILQQAAN